MGRILMTGATGFLGRNVAWRLVQNGHEVANLQRSSSSRDLLDANVLGRTVQSLQLTDDLQSAYSAVREYEPDCVISIAAMAGNASTPDLISKMLQSNVALPCALARGMVDVNKRAFISCGSSWQTCAMDGSYSPFDFYAGTKQAWDDLSRTYADLGLNVTSLRMFDNYGPGDSRNKIVDLIFKTAVSGDRLDMSPGEQKMDLVYVDDAAIATVMAAEQAMESRSSGLNIYGVSTRIHTKLKDVATMVQEVTGLPVDINWGGRSYRPREVMVPYSGLTTVPGWSPKTSLKDGLKRVWNAYCEKQK
jgi:nucleoside-diphosphate-sugar epimerase